MRHRSAVAVCVSLISLFGFSSVSAAASATQGAMSIAAFLARKPTAGVYILTAYLDEVDVCQPCPPRALCKPCIGDHVVLSDAARAPQTPKPAGAQSLMVFATPADIAKLQSGRRYRFQVEVGTVLHLKTAANLP
jgi:hypothetical protein